MRLAIYGSALSEEGGREEDGTYDSQYALLTTLLHFSCYDELVQDLVEEDSEI